MTREVTTTWGRPFERTPALVLCPALAAQLRLVERRGARVVSAAGEGSDDDSPTGKLMWQIIDAFAEYERAVIRACTKSAMGVAKKEGRRVGHVRWGQRVGDDRRTLVANPSEVAILEEIRWLRVRGSH